MTLIKGDSDNLEGRVVVFSTVGGKNSGLFACHDVDDLLALIENGEKKRAVVEQQNRVDVEKLSVSERGTVPVFVRFYFADCIFSSERWLAKIGADAIYIDKYETEEERVKLIQKHAADYMFAFEEQEKWIKRAEKKVKHSDIAPEQTADYARSTYIERMNFALADGNTKKACEIQREFRRFSRGSRFERFVPELCLYVHGADGCAEKRVIDLCVKKIDALVKEKYEDIRSYDARLEEIKQKAL